MILTLQESTKRSLCMCRESPAKEPPNKPLWVERIRNDLLFRLDRLKQETHWAEVSYDFLVVVFLVSLGLLTRLLFAYYFRINFSWESTGNPWNRNVFFNPTHDLHPCIWQQRRNKFLKIKVMIQADNIPWTFIR